MVCVQPTFYSTWWTHLPLSPSLVTQPKNFNLRGLSVVVKHNTNGVGLFYPEAMKLLSEEIDTH